MGLVTVSRHIKPGHLRSVLIARKPQIKGKGEEPLPEGAAYIVIAAKAGKGESGPKPYTSAMHFLLLMKRPCRRPIGSQHVEGILLQNQGDHYARVIWRTSPCS
jgi:hypothetical protein